MRIRDKADCINENCLQPGEQAPSETLMEYDRLVVGVNSPECRDQFERAVRQFEETEELATAR